MANRVALRDQLEQLAEGTPVVLPARRTVLIAVVAAGAALTIFGLALVAIALAGFSRLGPAVFFSKPFIGGAIASLAGAWVVGHSSLGLAHPRRLLLDAEGVREEVRSSGRWEPVSALGWSEIEEIFLLDADRRWFIPGTQLCCYRLTAAAANRRLDSDGPMHRFSTAAGANHLGPRVVPIAKVFGHASRLHRLLDSAHRRSIGAHPPPGD